MNYQKIFEKVNRDTSFLCPIVQEKARDSLEECHHLGFPAEIFEGWRSPLRQAQLYAQSRTSPGPWATDAQPWQSLHQFGLAIDLAFKVNGKWSWDNSLPWDRVAAIFKSHGFEWPKPKGEKAHFQITGGLSLKEIQKIQRDQGIPAVWLAISQGYTSAKT